MSAAHQEKSFEAAIEASLLGSGWLPGIPGNHRPELGLDTAELFTFIGDTQPKEWERLLAYHGNDPNDAQRAFAQYLGKQIDERGVLDVLRRGVKDRGVLIRLAYFKPAHTITDDALAFYRKNRLTVTRQLRYSLANTNALDLVLFVNGLPLATAELKNPLIGEHRLYSEPSVPRALRWNLATPQLESGDPHRRVAGAVCDRRFRHRRRNASVVTSISGSAARIRRRLPRTNAWWSASSTRIRRPSGNRDIICWEYDNGSGKIHHAAVVTSVVDG
jgi:hypothetical protein